MSVRVVTTALAMWALATSSVLALGLQETDAQPVTAAVTGDVSSSESRIEERALADLSAGMTAFVLSASSDDTEITFNLPPNIDTTEAWLQLAARPASATSDGLIHVSINGGDPITIHPEARDIQARFALYSDDMQAGENTLTIGYSAQGASAGWIVDAQRSRLRLSLDELRPLASLAELETTLAADFAAPRRIALMTDVSRQRVTLEGLVVQGVALRAGAVPLFTGDATDADLLIRIAENGRLEESEVAMLHDGAPSQGPEIAFADSATPHLVITGRNIDEAAAAARLFAARSFAGYGAHFLAADAVVAERLGRRQTRDAGRLVGADADLRTFSTSGLPFSADQGSRTAVQISAQTDSDRYGALSVLARAALVGGEAWLYAWYGEAHHTVPPAHNLLVIGPNISGNDFVQRNAPAEMHAAMRAAERSRGQRGLMRFAAAAYAAEGDADRVNIGVASVFANQDAPGTYVAALTSPDLASFAAAGRSLGRSDLWQSLEGRAAVWSVRGVTALDFTVASPSLQARVTEFANDYNRDAAFLLFGVALMMLVRGTLRRRRVYTS